VTALEVVASSGGVSAGTGALVGYLNRPDRVAVTLSSRQTTNRLRDTADIIICREARELPKSAAAAVASPTDSSGACAAASPRVPELLEKLLGALEVGG